MRAKRALFAVSLIALPLIVAPAALKLRPSILHAGDDDDDAPKKETPEEKAAREKTEAKEKKARKLLKLMGQYEVAKIQLDQMCKQFEGNPQLPAGFSAKFKELVKPKDFVEITVKAYAKNFESGDLDDLADFFEKNAAGKRFGEAQPKISEEVSKNAEKWGMEMGMKVMIALQNEGGGEKKKKGDKDDD